MVRYRKRSIAETISAVVINWLCEKPAGDSVREGRGEGGRKWEEEVGGWYGGVANVRSCADMNLLSLVWSGDWWENLWGIWEPDSRARWELEVVSLLHCPPPRSHPSLVSLILFSCVSFSFPFSPCQLSSLSPFFPNRLSFQFSCPLFLIFYFFPPRADISPPFTSISSEIFPSLHFLSSPPLLHSSTSSPAP